MFSIKNLLKMKMADIILYFRSILEIATFDHQLMVSAESHQSKVYLNKVMIGSIVIIEMFF